MTNNDPAPQRTLAPIAAAPAHEPSAAARAEAQAKFADTYGSKLWRLTHLYKIRDKNQKLRVFTINDIQQGIYDFIVEHFLSRGEPIRAFFLKYRQGGVSTFWLLWWLDEAIFKPNTINAILSHDHKSLVALGGYMRTAFINMPEALKPPLAIDNAAELAFGHGKLINGHWTEQSRMFVSLNIRSTPVHNLHISEHAHCSPEDIGASVGAVPPNGGITAETTAGGMNHSYEVYHEGKLAVEKALEVQPGILKSAFFPWFIQREYRIAVPPGMTIRRSTEEQAVSARAAKEYGKPLDDAQILYRRKLAKDTKGMRPQEFPENDEEAFLTSGSPFFTAKKILTLMREAKGWLADHPPVEEEDDYVVYEEPVKGHIYAAGADVAGDTNGDYSTLKIIDVTKRREVFRYRAHISPMKFYKVCAKWATKYNRALLGVERNNHGHAVLMGLEETARYSNIFYEVSKTRPRVQIITSTKSSAKEERKYGWLTDSNSRPLMLDQLRDAVEGEQDDDEEHFSPAWHLLDLVLCQEALTFTELDGKYQAAPGKFDDMIFASAIAHQMYLRLVRYATPAKRKVPESEGRIYRVDEEDRERF